MACSRMSCLGPAEVRLKHLGVLRSNDPPHDHSITHYISIVFIALSIILEPEGSISPS